MTTQTVRTWFRDGTELQGSPGVFSNCGFETVEQMRSELRQRWRLSFDAVDIPDGIRLTPKPHHAPNCLEGKQEITLDVSK